MISPPNQHFNALTSWAVGKRQEDSVLVGEKMEALRIQVFILRIPFSLFAPNNAIHLIIDKIQ
jgi:hypothetical protein